MAEHIKNCNGRFQCPDCQLNIIAYRGEDLQEKIAQHVCGRRKCPICYETIDEAEVKTHCCTMNKKPLDKGYHRLGMFDCETFEVGEDKTLQDNLVHFSYESCVAGIFHSITFTPRYFTYALSDSIEKNTFVFDYLPPTITNVFNPETGLLEVKKPPKKPRKSYKGNFKGQKVVVIDEEEEEGGGGAGLEEEGVEEVVAEQEEEDPTNPCIHWNLEEYIKKPSR